MLSSRSGEIRSQHSLCSDWVMVAVKANLGIAKQEPRARIGLGQVGCDHGGGHELHGVDPVPAEVQGVAWSSQVSATASSEGLGSGSYQASFGSTLQGLGLGL